MILINLFKLLGLPILAYLLGSIPWGLILTRVFVSQDLRRRGSGNIGATNVRRVAGNALAIVALAGDTFKGAFPVWLAQTLVAPHGVWGQIYIALVALAAFSGHLYPVFMRFKGGGKGVATTAGCFLVISPFACFVALLSFVMFICLCNRVSAGSLAGAAALPVAVWEATHSAIMTGCAAAMTLCIFIRHKDNLRRLWDGTEPLIWERET